MKDQFLSKGFAKLERLISPAEVDEIQILYDELLKDKTRTEGLRSDLSGENRDTEIVEKITQIMRPSLIEPKLSMSKAYEKALQHAQSLLGNDMDLDFDMLINKAPFTNTPTPWHQDAAYWIKMPDKRSVSCWIALDNVYEENGCMWFIPKRSENVKLHRQVGNGGALTCDANISEGECIPLTAGGCTFHDGFTLHFSKGNITANQRRALILNFRPKAMIELERSQGFDHTGSRKLRN